MIQLVDERGETVGEMEKIAAHQNGGVWHRAISVFLFDDQDRLLIQKRAAGKYHFAGLWANSCCSHPSTEESPEQAAHRAMASELGVHTPVQEVGIVRYEALDAVTGHWEREHDHVFKGRLTTSFTPNPNEVEEVRWVTLPDLNREIAEQPERFAPWLPIILPQLLLP